MKTASQSKVLKFREYVSCSESALPTPPPPVARAVWKLYVWADQGWGKSHHHGPDRVHTKSDRTRNWSCRILRARHRNIQTIPEFVRKVTSEHPDVDCLNNNAGVQKPINVIKNDPDEFLSKAGQEIDINIRGPMHLILQLREHVRSKPNALVVNVSSALWFVPFSDLNPVCCVTKSWMHFWSRSLRKQLEEKNVNVLEIAPPMVAIDLHRERANPDDNKELAPGTMTTDEFVDEVLQKWKGTKQ